MFMLVIVLKQFGLSSGLMTGNVFGVSFFYAEKKTFRSSD